jgi:hypothetical protein
MASHLEDGGDMFLRNVGNFSTDYTALYPRRYYPSNESFTAWFFEGMYVRYV